MSSFKFNASASRVLRRAGTAFVAGCWVTLALVAGDAEARGSGSDAFVHMVQVRGPGFADERANERAMRQAARAQRQQQMQGQRAQRFERMNQRPPERELAAPQPPVDRQVEGGRPGRMTPDERRALRQQINEAGRDVYQPNSRPNNRP